MWGLLVGVIFYLFIVLWRVGAAFHSCTQAAQCLGPALSIINIIHLYRSVIVNLYSSDIFHSTENTELCTSVSPPVKLIIQCAQHSHTHLLSFFIYLLFFSLAVTYFLGLFLKTQTIFLKESQSYTCIKACRCLGPSLGANLQKLQLTRNSETLGSDTL